MSRPWEVNCADCGCHLGYAFGSAPNQIYCGECAFKSDDEELEDEGEGERDDSEE